MRTLFLLGCLALVGCGSFRPQSDYQVVIDPTFTPEQLDAITAGLQVWQTKFAGKGLNLSVSIAPCSDAEAQTCLVPNHDTDTSGTFLLGYTHCNVGGGSYIQLYVDRYPTVVAQVGGGETLHHVLERTATHELGHALMGPEHLAAGNLMSAVYTDQKDNPTPTDMAHFWGVR